MRATKHTGHDIRSVHNISPSMERRKRIKRRRDYTIQEISGMRILIVDDSPTIVAYFESLLDQWGFRNRETANSAGGAMSLLLGENDFDLILLDIVLPDGDGIDICRKLKLSEKLSEIPIIMITGKENGHFLHEAFEAGAIDFISKPPKEDEMKARVTSALRLKRESDLRKDREAKLEELNRMKNRFIGMAAHDLRGPIATVRGLAEMILDSEGSPDNFEFLVESIKNVSQDALEIMDNLLDISIIESGKFQMSMNLADLGELVDNKVYFQKKTAERKNIRIEVFHKGGKPFWFDKVKVGQVIDNLISNAIKYAPHDTVIAVTHESSETKERISVINRGQGIPAEEQGKVFEAFEKTSALPTGGEKSVGLGLAISKKIVEAHRGTIEVTSDPGKKTIFSFTLPLG